MTHFDKKILNGMPVTAAAIVFCNSQIISSKESLKESLIEYYESEGTDYDLHEFERKRQLSKYMIAIYESKISIIKHELALMEIEVIGRLT